MRWLLITHILTVANCAIKAVEWYFIITFSSILLLSFINKSSISNIYFLSFTINITTINNKGKFESKEMLNFCQIHKEQFNNKLNEIKNNYTKNHLNKKFIKDISNNVVNKYNKKIKEQIMTKEIEKQIKEFTNVINNKLDANEQ